MLTLERVDRHRLWTWGAAGILASGAAIAVFGLPPVDLHGPLHRIGIMAPTCGGTRAARFTLMGDLDSAWEYNPLGIVAVAVSAVLVLRLGLGVASRRWVTLRPELTTLQRRLLFGTVALLVVALEIRQQMRADLLIADTWTLL